MEVMVSPHAGSDLPLVTCERCKRQAVLHPSFLHGSSDSAADEVYSGLTREGPEGKERTERIESTLKLFQVVNETVEMEELLRVPHPLCADCTHLAAEELLRSILELKTENEAYNAFMAQAMVEESRTDHEAAEQEAVRLAKEKEEELRKMVITLRAEAEAESRAQNTEHQAMAGQLRLLELSYWHRHAELRLQTQAFENESASIVLRTDLAAEQLLRLKRAHVLNEAFHVWHEGQFGTINGFRLGRLPSQPVDWPELNAALGQMCLLVDVLGRRLGMVWKTWRPVPCGSFSRLEDIRESISYELFGSSELSLGRLFWYRRFDRAMLALLDCIRQLADCLVCYIPVLRYLLLFG